MTLSDYEVRLMRLRAEAHLNRDMNWVRVDVRIVRDLSEPSWSDRVKTRHAFWGQLSPHQFNDTQAVFGDIGDVVRRNLATSNQMEVDRALIMGDREDRLGIVAVASWGRDQGSDEVPKQGD